MLQEFNEGLKNVLNIFKNYCHTLVLWVCVIVYILYYFVKIKNTVKNIFVKDCFVMRPVDFIMMSYTQNGRQQ